MTWTVTAAGPGDAREISAILSGWIDETAWMPRIHTLDEDRQFGKWLIEIMEVSVVKSDSRVLGFLARREQDIHSLYLAATARSRGIGAALLQHAKEQTGHLSLWTFQANVGARRFYARNGFVEDQLTDGQGNDEKLPDVHLTWTRKQS